MCNSDNKRSAMKPLHLTLPFCLMLLSTMANAEQLHGHRDGMTHPSRAMGDGNMILSAKTTPREPGQAAFAAIAEIVSILRADPQTDWSQANISTLRDHLSDMDRLVLGAETIATSVHGGLAIEVMFGSPGGAAAQRMVPAHAPVLAGETGWKSDVTRQTEQSLVWTVTSRENEAQIRALGFYGLMAIGAHHREHHLGIARGQMRH